VLRARANNAGKNPSWTSYEKLRTVIEKKMFSNTEELLPVISFNAKASADEAKKHEDFVTAWCRRATRPSRCACCASGTCACARAADWDPWSAGRPAGARSLTEECDAAADHRPRLAGKNKSIGNRERFLRRYKQQIREAVRRAVDGRGIRDLERARRCTSPRRTSPSPSSTTARAASATWCTRATRST
jgi:hypothetical protein